MSLQQKDDALRIALNYMVNLPADAVVANVVTAINDALNIPTPTPLSWTRIDEMVMRVVNFQGGHREMAKAVEREHGIITVHHSPEIEADLWPQQ
ncbi:MAG: hypothetical protein EBU90_07355 [Proteobacteria bacterium]|nr:hypothetical protein [Pseudomonadota bacterium]NBP13480.1 hypothetical protein [bacterium]